MFKGASYAFLMLYIHYGDIISIHLHKHLQIQKRNPFVLLTVEKKLEKHHWKFVSDPNIRTLRLKTKDNLTEYKIRLKIQQPYHSK